MNSSKATLFLKMQEKIAADIPGIIFIDRDNNQLEAEAPPVLFPCALISFPEAEYQQMQGFQNVKRKVRIKLATDRLQNTSAETPAPQLEEGLNFWELEQQVYESFQYWDADGLLADELIRSNDETEANENGLNVVVIDFECAFADESAD